MIIFKKLRWKNFLSYGNYWSEIDLLNNKSTLISGKNGGGKSSILESLIFSLFGRPYRNINKPLLVNSINEKDCVVEIEFSIGDKEYLVRRGLKPIIFEIYQNKKLINQESTSKDYQKYLEQNILKMNYKSFTQLVVLGSSSFIPFMQLPALERRNIIEDLLDIKVFSKMNTVLKSKYSLIKEKTNQNEYEQKIIKTEIETHKKYLEKQMEKKTISLTSLSENIKENENLLSEYKQKEISILEKIGLLKDKIIEESSIDKKLNDILIATKKIESSTSILSKNYEFYNKNSVCPSCNQNISEELKCNHTKEIQNQIEENNEKLKILNKKRDDLLEKSKFISDIKSQIVELNKQLSDVKYDYYAAEKYLNKIKTDFEEAKQKDTEEIQKQEITVKNLEDKLELLKTEKDSYVETKHYYDIAGVLLKDTGIKTKIIKQYLPLMNSHINKFLKSMDFFVNFNLDENFKEVIKSRHRDEFSYESFSEGEKFRIDMSLILTWREISRAKNSTNTNILFLDEVFDSSLDSNGTDEFLKLLNQLSEKINVFVISHKPDLLIEKFKNHISVKKKKQFSYLA